MELLGRLRDRRRDRDTALNRLREQHQDVNGFFRSRPFMTAALISRAEVLIANRIAEDQPEDRQAWLAANQAAICDELMTGFGLESLLATIIMKIVTELIAYIIKNLGD